MNITRDRDGVYFIEGSPTSNVERFTSPREVREFLRIIPNGKFARMGKHQPVFSGFENYREIENSFRALYNVRAERALSASSSKRAKTKTSENYEYSLKSA